MVIANGREPEVIIRLVSGEAVGTFFQPTTSRLESRKRWLLSKITRGKLFIDSGASMAVQRQNKSLLAAGITEADGEFERGEVVNIFNDESKRKIACGISNYSSDDIAIIKGAHSDEIMGLLGYEYGTEVVHRDNLVLL